MTIGLGDVLRTAVNFTLGDGTLFQNVFHHRKVGLGIDTDATHVAAIQSWANAMYAELIVHVHNGVVAALSSVDRVEWVTDQWKVVENIGVFSPTFVPTGSSEALPNQVSAFIVFKTERPKSVGRKFLFPMVESSSGAGILVASCVTQLVAWADDALSNIVIDAPLDYLVPGIPRTAEDTFLDFSLAVVTNLVGTQRRRRPGYGA